MLAVSPLRSNNTKGEMVDITPFSVFDFPEFASPVGCLLDTIDFDDLINDCDVLPDLGMDPADFMAKFSISGAGDPYSDDSDTANQVVPDCYDKACFGGDECKDSVPDASKEDEIELESEKSILSTRPAKEREKSKKLSSSSQAKKNNNSNNNNSKGKRKTKKVDWTPDLHRRFVQAVEQLGVDKAVPSRILELMGIDCLTRHNVASHLQKYRSHRKHLLAREAEATSWSQNPQMYGIAVAPAGGGGGKNKVNHQWHPPTVGFPPITPPPIHHHHHQSFWPLHVWGHPTHHVEHQSMMPVWPKQLVLSPSPMWATPPLVDPSFWHSHHQHVPNAVTPTTSCFPQTLPTTRFAAAPPIQGIPPPHAALYKPQQSAPSAQSAPNHPPIDLHPTKESIDAAIGDVSTKPWLPLPIGLKPPSMDSVRVELQRQGVPKIPPSSCS